MNRTLLEQPFAPAQIKQRRGRTGGVLDYVEGWSVIARLNEAFEGAWSFEVTWHEIRETEVLVLGRLPQTKPSPTYDPRFSVDRFGVAVACAPDKVETVGAMLSSAGAEEVRR